MLDMYVYMYIYQTLFFTWAYAEKSFTISLCNECTCTGRHETLFIIITKVVVLTADAKYTKWYMFT